MVPESRGAIAILLAAFCFCSHILVSSALSEEERLRAAISDFNTLSFEVVTDIKLTQDLPPLALSAGKVRIFRIFSKTGKGIVGNKKVRALWIQSNSAVVAATSPVARLTVDNVKFTNLRVRASSQPVDFGLVGLNGAAIGMLKSSITVLNSVFSSNRATTGAGGAMYTSGGTLTVKNTTFSSNYGFLGGAIGISGTALTIEDSSFLVNFGDRRAALSINNIAAVVKVSRTVFRNNFGYSGGAVRANFDPLQQPAAPMLFDTCTFASNSVYFNPFLQLNSGGAFLLDGVKEIRFIKPVFTTNNADVDYGVPVANNMYISTAGTFKTTIRVISGAITDIIGNIPNNFVATP